ncbi:MAG: SpoIIE family protein phosphatase [Leptospiraceae bacterium]|nr:SpoIIE family protein phosphatase [Leptospiraceae bacterium]
MTFLKSYKDIKIRTKMILLICGVVLISVLPLSLIVLYRSQAVVLKKTYEVCRNLASNLSNLITEELLINETYDSTRTAITRLKDSSITGLLSAYVINIDGNYVAEMSEKKVGKHAEKKDLEYFFRLKELDLTEKKSGDVTVLQFSYPIFINYHGEQMRVGTAVFEFDKSKVYEPVVKIRTSIIGVSGILFAVGIVIAALAAIMFSKPIQKLTDGAKIIGDGNLSYRIRLKGKDELGQLASTFNQMTEQIQDFTQNLELKVAQRTDELNKTLQEVQALKIAQDGDYYLTSLLISPLQPNNNSSKNVKTEFIVEQKKKFTFRKWNAQIGGDICITDSIVLNDREYTVFINGDAMGKSIQGAGGALVLGVVFNAGLIRSKIEKFQNAYPEAWLKDKFLDLHNVFQSFDGSMYISICMGLIDNETGLMYYINAEHPWTILYRDNKASFLEEELVLRKIGTPDQEDDFYVRVFQLQEGDIVITGSDGRDDLVVQNPDGTESVQEDETAILRRVEEAQGDLKKIEEGVKAFGKLMDDLSLLKIEYHYMENANDVEITSDLSPAIEEGNYLLDKGKYDEALKKIEGLVSQRNNFPELLKLLGRLYYNKNDYLRAIDCFEQYINLCPGDNDYLYALSNTYRMVGNYNKAADVGERLYLRDKKDFLNLVNLAYIYYSLGVTTRAQLMIESALYIQPENEQAKKLQAKIVNEKPQMKEEKNGMAEQAKLAKKKIKEAEFKYKNKEYEEALGLFESILEGANFNNPKFLLRIANCHYHLGTYDLAVIYYKRTIQEDGKNPYAHNNLGNIYFKQGDFRKAKIEWIKSVEIKNDYEPARANLKKIESMEPEQFEIEYSLHGGNSGNGNGKMQI